MRFVNPDRIPWGEYLAMHLRGIVVIAAAAIAVLILLACTDLPGGSVISGRVVSQGKPVVFGTVTVIASDNRAYSAPIRADGTYLIRDVPPGPVRAAVSSPSPWSVSDQQAVSQRPPTDRSDAASRQRGTSSAGAKAEGTASGRSAAGDIPGGVSIAAPSQPAAPAFPPDAGQASSRPGWFRIPGRYASPATSGIDAEVRRGRTTLDMTLD